MPHIHLEPNHFDHTASALIFRTTGAEPEILLHKHKIMKKMLQPGGHVELTENHWEALQHEILEETGYGINQLKILQPQYITEITLTHPHIINQPIPFIHNTHPIEYSNTTHYHSDAMYVFTTTESPDHKIGENESNEFAWLTLKDIENTNPNNISIIIQNIAPTLFTTIKNPQGFTLLDTNFFEKRK